MTAMPLLLLLSSASGSSEQFVCCWLGRAGGEQPQLAAYWRAWRGEDVTGAVWPQVRQQLCLTQSALTRWCGWWV